MTALLVASTGGHLAQLHQLRPRLVPTGMPVVWATFDSPQSRSMLASEVVEYVRYTAPRDVKSVLVNVRRAVDILRKHRVEAVYSTGSGIALSFLPAARALGVEAHYIESAARSDGPSVTGRVLQKVPGVHLYSQYQSWANAPWGRSVSVFDDFLSRRRDAETEKVRSVVVTLGTMQRYGFRRLVERLLDILPADVSVTWQVGATEVTGLPVSGRESMPQHELHAAMAEADVVIAHSGIGSALGALKSGCRPLLVPRSAARGEHVDDHQVQIARELDGRNLAIHRDVDDLAWADVEEAARWEVRDVRPATAALSGAHHGAS